MPEITVGLTKEGELLEPVKLPGGWERTVGATKDSACRTYKYRDPANPDNPKPKTWWVSPTMIWGLYLKYPNINEPWILFYGEENYKDRLAKLNGLENGIPMVD
jgi:hypothetical protein